MEKPSRRSVSVLLAGVRCSPLPPSSCPAALRSGTCSWGTLFKCYLKPQDWRSPRGHADLPEPTQSSGGSSRAEPPRRVPPWSRVTRVGTSGPASWGKQTLHLGNRCQAGAAGDGCRELVPWAPRSIFWEQRRGPRRGEVVTGTQRVPWGASPIPVLL